MSSGRRTRPSATPTYRLLSGLAGRRTAAMPCARCAATLRTELYALDASDRQDRPYTVTEIAVRPARGTAAHPSRGGRRRIFFPFVAACGQPSGSAATTPSPSSGSRTGMTPSASQPRKRVALPRRPRPERGDWRGRRRPPRRRGQRDPHPRDPHRQRMRRAEPGLYLHDRVARTGPSN